MSADVEDFFAAAVAAAQSAAQVLVEEDITEAAETTAPRNGTRRAYSGQPRRGSLHSAVRQERWRAQSGSSPWWVFYTNAKTPPGGDLWWRQAFRNRFRVSIDVFEVLYGVTNAVDKWADTVNGDGRR
eukprot:6204713-Pleurochrysis_carterae.AAC.1